jgi:hypothetical protein
VSTGPGQESITKLERQGRWINYASWIATGVSASAAGWRGWDWYNRGDPWTAFGCGLNVMSFFVLVSHGALWRANSRFHLRLLRSSNEQAMAIVEAAARDNVVLVAALAEIHYNAEGRASEVAGEALKKANVQLGEIPVGRVH